jgi:hypothetical protein
LSKQVVTKRVLAMGMPTALLRSLSILLLQPKPSEDDPIASGPNGLYGWS